MGDPVGIPFIRKLTLGNPVGGIHTVSVEGEGVFGDNIILPVIKNISLQDYQALGGGIHTVSLGGATVGDPMEFDIYKELSIQDYSDITSGQYTLSVNGDPVGDPILIPFVKDLSLQSALTSGSNSMSLNDEVINFYVPYGKTININNTQGEYYTMSVNGSVVDTIYNPFIKELSLYSDQSGLNTGSYSMSLNDEVINFYVPYEKSVIVNNTNSGNYRVSVNGSVVGDSIQIPFVKKIIITRLFSYNEWFLYSIN